MSTLDSLFRERLSDHSLPPSRNSWDRVEAGLHMSAAGNGDVSKKNEIIWLRYAAAVAFGGLLLTLLFMSNKPADTITKNDPLPVQSVNPAVEQPRRDPVKKAIRKNTLEQTHRNGLQEPQVEKVESDLLIGAIVLESETVQVEEPAVKQEAGTRPMVLVYTLGPVQASAPASDLAVREGTLKKVFDFASSVKNSDTSPVGELRSVKQDLFALDFKKITNSKKQ